MGKFTGLHWNDSFGMEPYVCEALRNYMKPAPPPQKQAAVAPSESGYQWKEVFLPEGTRLRASFDHRQYFAVEGAAIKYGEHAISPSCFANLFGSGNRNAWKAVWLRLPGSDAWLLADVCRAARKAAIARLMEGAADRRGQPPRPQASAGGANDGTRVRAERPPAPPQPGPRATGAATENGAQRNKGSGRSARHKRRAAKRKSDAFHSPER
ncbi:hypothetical protein [Duganella aceris]|uniref:Uncharacterized protein n=1 Tax=Duganella aceris TaxID=2703883 RepID=A0ABX0FF12_9BURK|nr:hypothetical protein [Duganella aceris]NGZ83133.1 hypothetical protein [Duganella aceris]